MRGATPPLPQGAFMPRCLVKHRDNFTFTFKVQCNKILNILKQVGLRAVLDAVVKRKVPSPFDM
jgi:hypothetical protein